MARARATVDREPASTAAPVRVLRGMAWRQDGTQVAVTCPDGHDAQYTAAKHGDGGRVTCACGYEIAVVLDGLE